MRTPVRNPPEICRRWQRVNRMRDGVHERRCAHCEHWFPATPEYFHRHGAKRLHGECKACANAYARKWQKAAYVPRARTTGREAAPKQNYDASALDAALRPSMR